MPNGAEIFSSLFWFNDGNNEAAEVNEPDVIKQFVDVVDDFSSQYGSEISVSYTAFNLRGPPSNFPYYGDYPQAFVMRTYGKWWQEAPSHQIDFVPQSSRSITSQDFVEVSFTRQVYPLEVAIFETYNPGALVRIWAWSLDTWVLLWEGEPEYAGDTPRVFSPTIRQIHSLTRTLRLEFNHTVLPYYTELDAVLLRGLTDSSKGKKSTFAYKSFFLPIQPVIDKGVILNSIISSRLHEKVGHPKAIPNNCVLEYTELSLSDFERLPDETILAVLKYLDIQSLCRCAQVNTHFNRLASDSILYRCIDLRPYWHCVTGNVLEMMAARCTHLHKLDLSWCGSHGMIPSKYVIDFLKECGSDLTHLRMNCCKFVSNIILKTITVTSYHLKELCFRSVVGCTDWIKLASLKELVRLDLYRTDITTAAAVYIIMANPGLQHLNLGACKMISSMDEVAITLGRNCPNLISVDFWKSFSLTPNGIHALSKCRKLQELDVGWCLQAGGSGEWLAWLNSSQLRKLFLGALRGISDRDLRALLPAPNLSQLDLLGVRALTAHGCNMILAECPKLRLLDVSFCDQIQDSQVQEWRVLYPQVSIKRSFQSVNLTTEPNPLFLAPINFD